MNLIVSNYGMRLLQNSIRHQDEPLALPADAMMRLLDLRVATLQPATGEGWQTELLARGLAQTVAPEVSADEVELRYRRNPLEHIERLVFEYTTVCNLDCDHCRNGHLPAATEARPERLCEAVDLALPLGIRRFDFIGGEVILYGAKWLRVVEHIRQRGGATSAVVTSGWFLDERHFKAAGRTYDSDAHLLTELAEAGLTHVVFSLDGPAALHDRWRKVPGLYDRVIAGFDKVRAAGMTPQVSLVVSPALGEAALPWMAEVSAALYGLAASTPWRERLHRLQSDQRNYLSNLVDTGNAVQLRRKRGDLGGWSDATVRCKNFFRPHPSLRIQATGEVSLCPLIDSGEGYGNVHQRGLLDVMNRMQDAFVYKLHADNLIGGYRRFLDPELFGGRFEHVCALRTVLAMVARRMDERGVSEHDAEGIRAINVEVARRAGYLPPEGRTGNGTGRP